MRLRRGPQTPSRPPIAWGRAAVCLYAGLIPLQPVLMMPDGSHLRFAAADAVAPLVLLAAIAAPQRRLSAGLTLVAIGIPLLALFSTLIAARDRSLTWYAVGKTAGLAYLVSVALAAARALERGAEPAVLRALAFGGLWSAVMGLAGYAAWLAGIPNSLVSGGRLCSTMPGDPNIYCSLVAVALLITAMDARLTIAGRVARVGVLALALLLTGSRSGVVGAALGLAIAAFASTRDPWSTAARGVWFLMIGALVAAVAFQTAPGNRVAALLGEQVWRTWTVENRFTLYARALQLFSEHPLLGLGIGGFNDLNTWTMEGRGGHIPVHNTYLWAFVDLGIVGGMLLAGLVVGAIWCCARAAARRPAPSGAGVVAGGLAAMAGFNLFVDGFYQRHFWVLMACALGLPVARRVRRVTAWRWRTGPTPFPVAR